MPLTPPATYAPGDTITSAWANILGTDLSLLDGRTGGDPGAAGKIPVSTGTLGATWLAAGTEAYILTMVSGVPVWRLVQTASIQDGAVTTLKLQDRGITNLQVSVTPTFRLVGANLEDGTITFLQVSTAPGSRISTNNLEDASITGGKISTTGGQRIADTNIEDGAITNAKLAGTSVHTGNVQDGAITGAKISTTPSSRIGDTNIEDGAITDNKYGGTSIATAKLKDGIVTAVKSSAGVGTNGKVLQTNGTDWAWADQSTLAVGSATTATTASNATQLGGVAAAGYALVADKVPSGAIVMFRTAAEIPSGWTRESSMDGRIPVGAGTVGGVTFTENSNFGSTWTPSAGLGATNNVTASAGTVAASASSQATGSATATLTTNLQTHTHPGPTITIGGTVDLTGTSATYNPPVSARVFARH